MEAYITDHVSFVREQIRKREDEFAKDHQLMVDHASAVSVLDLEAIWSDFRHVVEEFKEQDIRVNELADDRSGERVLNQWYADLAMVLPVCLDLIPRIQKLLDEIDYKSYSPRAIADDELAGVREQVTLMLESAKEWLEWKPDPA